MHQIPVRSVSISVVLLRGGGAASEVLLLRRTRTLAGTWCQIAGTLEAGETAWQAALRETREETGLVPTRLYAADICEQFYEAGRDCIAIVPVFVGVIPVDAAVTLNDEHSDHCWLPIRDAIALVPFAGQRRVLAEIAREFIDRPPNPLLLIDTGAGGR